MIPPITSPIPRRITRPIPPGNTIMRLEWVTYAIPWNKITVTRICSMIWSREYGGLWAVNTKCRNRHYKQWPRVNDHRIRTTWNKITTFGTGEGSKHTLRENNSQCDAESGDCKNIVKTRRSDHKCWNSCRNQNWKKRKFQWENPRVSEDSGRQIQKNSFKYTHHIKHFKIN